MNCSVRVLVDFCLQRAILILFIVANILLSTTDSFSISTEEYRNFEKSIIDHRQHLNPHFKKIKRNCTQYIIVHTSECDLKTTLKIVSKGKQENYKWISRGGHAHYVIARNGQTYRILDKKYKANHAGLSMWNGQNSISRISIGIELVAYHDRDITASQYESIRILADILKSVYRLDNRSVLTHSQVAYARPNQKIAFNHRGRKHCARNFDRIRAGLGSTWPYDPDVKAGRLKPDPELSAVFYDNKWEIEAEQITEVINPPKTVWAIAGRRYNSPNTLYQLPNGFIISGNRVDSRIGWHRLPIGTKVFLY